MKTMVPRYLLLSILALIAASTVRADRFELSNGSTIIGKLVAAEGGKFTVETDFAGKIEICPALSASSALPQTHRLD